MKRILVAATLVLTMATALPAIAGPMRGVNGHTASGSATIDAGQVVLGPDFRFDGGPDVYVAIKNGRKIRLLAKLRANEGAQSYALPAENADAEEILLFCKQFNVTLGRALVN